MKFGSYNLDILVQGYPGKSICHGSLGWSTIALLRGEGRVALIDVGAFSQRALIQSQLAAHGLKPADVTDVVLTHAHYDHSINWLMFPKARVYIGGSELDWSLTEPWGTSPVPELYVRELAGSSQLVRVSPGMMVLPGMVAHFAPGHTPGHMIYAITGGERDVIFTGDAAKNRVELITLEADMTYDPAVTRASIELMWRLWRQKPDTVLVPGHDVPMVLKDGKPTYLGERRAAIASWFGEKLDQTTMISLVT
jgi:glyoxylase-like metal-dependent hydrolase (beta-lactamase superfamily II)